MDKEGGFTSPNFCWGSDDSKESLPPHWSIMLDGRQQRCHTVVHWGAGVTSVLNTNALGACLGDETAHVLACLGAVPVGEWPIHLPTCTCPGPQLQFWHLWGGQLCTHTSPPGSPLRTSILSFLQNNDDGNHLGSPGAAWKSPLGGTKIDSALWPALGLLGLPFGGFCWSGQGSFL